MGVKDIRMEEFELPGIKEDEILLKILCNGIAVYFKRDHACTEASEGSEEHTEISDLDRT